MKALVIDLLARAYGERYTSYDVVGAGPRVVAGTLEYVGVKADLITYEEYMKEGVFLDEYDIILFSAMSSDKIALKKSIERALKSNIITMIGGPVSFEFYDILRSIGGDIVIVGEGELSLIKLFREYHKHLISRDYEELNSIPGLALNLENKIVFTGFPEYTPVDLLNKIRPYVRVDRVYRKPWYYRFYVEVLRGCSNFQRPRINLGFNRNCIQCNKCTSQQLYIRLWCPKGIPPGCGFCSVPFHFGPPRSLSTKRILDEINGLIKHGARRIVLSAPDFLDYGRDLLVKPQPLTNPCNPPPNYKAIETLLEEIFSIPEVEDGLVKIFIENIKACLVDKKIGKILGTYLKNTTIHMGLETASLRYNTEVIGKPIGLKDVLKAIRILRKNKLRPYIYLIYGLPYMDEKVYRETIDAVPKLFKAGTEKITLYKFIPLPMTAFEFFGFNRKYNKYVQKLKNIINKYNLKAKKKFLGKNIEAYIVCSKKRMYGYPVDHGPVIFIYPRKSRFADKVCRAIVKIYDISPRYVVGKIMNIIECY